MPGREPNAPGPMNLEPRLALVFHHLRDRLNANESWDGHQYKISCASMVDPHNSDRFETRRWQTPPWLGSTPKFFFVHERNHTVHKKANRVETLELEPCPRHGGLILSPNFLTSNGPRLTETHQVFWKTRGLLVSCSEELHKQHYVVGSFL